MSRLAVMVMYQQKMEQVAQVVSLTIFTKMQVATAFRFSVVMLIMVLELVVFGICVMILVIVAGIAAVRPVILPSEGLQGDTSPCLENILG